MNVFSDLWKIKTGDWLRGLMVAVLTAPLTVIYESVSAGSLTFKWKEIVLGAIAGGLAYILKNLLTGQNGNLLTNK